MGNRVIQAKAALPVLTRVSDLPSGTLVRLGDIVYITLQYRGNSARIGAVSLTDGGYLYPETFVTPLLKGERFEIEVQ